MVENNLANKRKQKQTRKRKYQRHLPNCLFNCIMVELCKICTSTNDGFALIKHSINNVVCSLMTIIVVVGDDIDNGIMVVVVDVGNVEDDDIEC